MAKIGFFLLITTFAIVSGNNSTNVEGEFAGGTLKLTWTDCGNADTKGKVKSLLPDTVTLGQKTTLTGTGSMSETVTGGTFKMVAHASFIHKTYTGDICKPATFELPLHVGTITWDGLKCPVAAGDVSIQEELTISAHLPARLAKATIQASAKQQTVTNFCA